MPAFSTYNRNGFNSRLRDQGITRQVFSRFGSTETSSTISRSCVTEDSQYSIYVSSRQSSGATLRNPIISKFDKKGDEIWSVAIEDTFSADRYSLYAKGTNVPINGTVSVNVNTYSTIYFWFSKITSTGSPVSSDLLAATNNTIFWIIVNNDPTRKYKLAFAGNESEFGTYYRQEIYKNQYDATRFVNDINSNVIQLNDSFQLFFEDSYKYEEIPITVDTSDDIIMAFRSYKNLSSILYSDNLSGSSWSTYCGSSTNFTANTTDLPAPNGTFTASKIVRNSNTSCGASTSWGRFWNSSSLVSTGTNYTLSIYVRGAIGGEVVSFGIADGNVSNYTLTTQWQRITYTANALSTSRGLQIFSSQPNVTFYFWGARVERTSLIDTERRYKVSVVKLAKNNGSIKWFSELSLKSDAYIENFNTTAQSDVKSIITDSDKNIYLCGSAFAAAGPFSGVGNNYGFIAKLNEYGSLLWKKSMYASQAPISQTATDAAQQITSLSLSPDGFLYASGGSTTVNGAGPCLYKLNTLTGDLESGWPILYNLDLSLNKFLFITEIDTDTEGNIYGIIGNLGEPESLFDYSVIKFDSSGNIIWCNRYDTNDTTESGYNLIVDRTDVIYVSGRCDTVLNERPGVLGLNTDGSIEGFRRIRYRRDPFIDETSISMRKSKTFSTTLTRNRHTFILNETGLNGFVIGMIQKEKTSVGTYETPLDRYIVSGSNPIITDIISILIFRSYFAEYRTDNYMTQAFGTANNVLPLLDYKVLSKVEVPQ
jgi:hypothetical protein